MFDSQKDQRASRKLIRPEWVEWARFQVPSSFRWLAFLVALLCLAGLWSVLTALGDNITPVEFTRKQHDLVVDGPYRWIRHPLYTLGGLFWSCLGVTTALWPVAIGFLSIVLLLALRVSREERELEERFGDSYRQYKLRTGRFFPRLR